MKNRLIILAVCLLAGCNRPRVEVPAAVKQTFATRFPGVKEVSWSVEGQNEFEAEFETGAVQQSANFDASGHWLETETKVNVSEIPEAVKETIAREYAGYAVGEAEKVETPEQNGLYEIELRKDNSVQEVLFSSDGKVKK